MHKQLKPELCIVPLFCTVYRRISEVSQDILKICSLTCRSMIRAAGYIRKELWGNRRQQYKSRRTETLVSSSSSSISSSSNSNSTSNSSNRIITISSDIGDNRGRM